MTGPRHPTIALALLASSLSLAAAACAEIGESPRAHEAYYDAPHTIPAGVPYEGPALTEPETQDVATSEECPRGRGIDPDGECVRLATQELEFGGMVQIPAGAFIRGDIPQRYDASRAQERAHVQNAGQPIFEDRLPSYWIDGFEISRKAYVECVEAGACTPAACLDGGDGRPTIEQLGETELAAYPQTCVTHRQAEGYCEWRGARLPTEAEWEYAARGPQGWVYPWGHQFRDELGLALGPVGFDPLDVSYFGLKGFGGNAIEWVADAFDQDANLSRYLAGEFRSEDGPVARAFAQWTAGLCGGSACELGQRFAVKGGRSGARAAAWQLAEGRELAEIPTSNFEGDKPVAQHERLGFRCAKDLDPEITALTVPEPTVPLPLYRQEADYDMMLVVAEAVSRQEAERFCSVLRAPGDPESPPPGGNGWRLPTLEEIRVVARWFGGPGPFWSADGAVEQTFVDQETAEWEPVEASDDAPLMARCIRG